MNNQQPMKQSSMIGIIVGLFLLVAVGMTVSTYISYKRKDNGLRNEVKAQQKNCESYSDKMWKVLQQKAQVTDQYKEAFMKIYPQLMEGRYDKGGDLFKMVTESNPTFDVSLYKDLMNSISVERTAFFEEQKRLIDMKREHDNLRMDPIASFFISDEEVLITVITSERTKGVYATGEENDIDLFAK